MLWIHMRCKRSIPERHTEKYNTYSYGAVTRKVGAAATFSMQNRHADPLSILASEFMFDKDGLPARLDKITAADAASGQVSSSEDIFIQPIPPTLKTTAWCWGADYQRREC